MTDTTTRIDKAQYGVAALLAAVGAYTVYDATTLNVGFGDPVGPRAFPYVIGSRARRPRRAAGARHGPRRRARGRGRRGRRPHPVRADWPTVLKLVGVLVFTIATVGLARLGDHRRGALRRRPPGPSAAAPSLRDVLVGAVLAVGSWYLFYVGLDIPLSPGVLDGVL